MVGGAAAAITNLAAGEPLKCSAVAETDTELKKAIDDWGAAIETPREPELKIKVEENSDLFFQALRDCNEAKLVRLIVTIISLTAAVSGLLLTIVGFFIGRKNAGI